MHKAYLDEGDAREPGVSRIPNLDVEQLNQVSRLHIRRLA